MKIIKSLFFVACLAMGVSASAQDAQVINNSTITYDITFTIGTCPVVGPISIPPGTSPLIPLCSLPGSGDVITLQFTDNTCTPILPYGIVLQCGLPPVSYTPCAGPTLNFSIMCGINPTLILIN